MTTPWPARPATADDYPHFVRLFAELGVHDPVPDPVQWASGMLPATIFVEHEGAPIAYAMLRALGTTGYLAHVVVEPAWRGRRVGTRVMEVVAARLRELGCVRWRLNVKVDNVPAIRLYERCGLSRSYRATTLTFPWACVARLPREAAAIEARLIEPDEDAVLDGAFAQLDGRVRSARERGDFVLMRLVDPARPDDARLGVACFRPTHPGAFPFVVARPGLAAPLLEALRPHARPCDAFLHITPEDDEALTATLVAAGATVGFELFHMTGELPRPGGAGG